MKKRHFARLTISAIALLTPLRNLFANNSVLTKGILAKTPWDYEGPFYPTGARNRTNDLIRHQGRGNELTLSGHVVDVDAQARAGLRVEIWQADGLGRYLHPRDSSTGERWKEFLYWGEASTQDNGKFMFRTYLPGAYGGRPAHIHYKVWHEKKLLLTSQFYFKETGGARGVSKSPQLSEYQTVSLTTLEKGIFEARARIVV